MTDGGEHKLPPVPVALSGHSYPGFAAFERLRPYPCARWRFVLKSGRVGQKRVHEVPDSDRRLNQWHSLGSV